MKFQSKYKYDERFSTDTYEFKEISYEYLMQKRIINVLLICSNYDAFMLEEDGRINEKIFLEYTSKNLRYPPQFTQASSSDEAFRLMEEKDFDLVITMLNVGKIDCFEMAKRVRKRYPGIPIVVLTHFSREVSIKLRNEDLSSIDYVFSWLGNAGLLLAIIKLLEDKMNADYDIEGVGVQGILLVEDSIRYYSSYLPTIYKVIFDQTNELMTEGLNEHRKTLRMRARPKILLAKTYDDALALYKKYKKNLLGVISDISYAREGKRDDEAGIRLAKYIRKRNSQIPILLQSSEKWDATINKNIDVSFINKYSKTLLIELKHYIKENYGFGDFVFKDPESGMEVTRANNLHSLQVKISKIDPKILEYHVSNDHFSRWLKARALFSIANIFGAKSREDFNNIEEIRSYLIDTIANYRRTKGRGIIASHMDEYAVFTRLGDGQLGGKARGLAFIDYLINKYKITNYNEDVSISIPRTVVLTTDIFDEFMEDNDLYGFALDCDNDEKVLERFVQSRTPNRMKSYVKEIVDFFKSPLAVRSSSLLEDSHYQPFAGVYSTYMISNNHHDKNIRILQLEQAIKSVYASVFFQESKAYIEATSNVIDEEKMAVVVQEVSGKSYGNMFYPTISGVARSVNFYPIEPEKYEDGVASIAFGLGKTIVDGEISLRFSPKYPEKSLQLSNTEIALRDSQKEFYSLNMDPEMFQPVVDETINLNKIRIRKIKGESSLKYVASTYDYEDNIIRDGLYDNGIKLITFANVLKHRSFPLPEILQKLLKVGQKEMNNQVEIEFAVTLDVARGDLRHFHFLQIRPVVETQEKTNVKLSVCKPKDTIIISQNALGNGIIDDIHDFIYVKPDAFDSAHTKEMAEIISTLNTKFTQNGGNYILVGPGRWGSNDPWLGIPVKWAQISAARLIVESGLKHFHIDPSQGTHFFQNLTSFSVGYFTINPYLNEGHYDLDFLDKQEAVYEDQYIRHVRFQNPLTIKIDGSKKIGVVMKP
jgi:CheY-like chemotaxis protein